jgi:hypothetical protein
MAKRRVRMLVKNDLFMCIRVNVLRQLSFKFLKTIEGFAKNVKHVVAQANFNIGIMFLHRL